MNNFLKKYFYFFFQRDLQHDGRVSSKYNFFGVFIIFLLKNPFGQPLASHQFVSSARASSVVRGLI